jgi:cold shock CspA family protein
MRRVQGSDPRVQCIREGSKRDLDEPYARGMPQATVKRYDSLTKTGTLVSDDGNLEYTVDPVAIETGMFRFLRPGQRVTFDVVSEEGESRVRNLRIGVG